MKNPFLASLEIAVLNKKTIKIETSEVVNGATHLKTTTTSTKPIEVQEFVKVYRYPKQIGLLKLLSPAGCRLYLYVQMKLKEDEDFLNLKREKVAKELDVSLPTVSLALANLMEHGVLAKKSQSEYWINPYILFKGNRLEYIKKENPDAITYLTDRNPTVFRYGKVDDEAIIV